MKSREIRSSLVKIISIFIDSKLDTYEQKESLVL
jgi:hypothetical protein